MATDYSTQINAWFEAIQQRPAPQASIVSYNAILNNNGGQAYFYEAQQSIKGLV